MLKKKIALLLALIAIFFCLSSIISPVFAASLNDAFKVKDGSPDDTLDSAADKAGYNIGKTDIFVFVSKGISIGLSFIGVIFLLLLIYGGYLWMTDRGNEDQVAKAKKLIQAAVIGLIIVVAAYSISWFVINVLTQSTLKNT